MASKTAFSLLEALEGEEDVQQAAAVLPVSDEVIKLREMRAKKAQAKQELQQVREKSRAAVAAITAQRAQQQEPQQRPPAPGPPTPTLPFELIKRTRMCNEWVATGGCSGGDSCLFSHDLQEMKANRARVKAYQAEQYAKVGLHDRPAKVHSHEHVYGILHKSFKVGGDLHKTRICRYYMKGLCQFGARCAFAHGAAELRAHLKDELLVQEELGRWGLLGDGQGGAAPGAAASSSSSIAYTRRPPQPPPRSSTSTSEAGQEEYSYIDTPFYAAGGGGPQFGYPPASSACPPQEFGSQYEGWQMGGALVPPPLQQQQQWQQQAQQGAAGAATGSRTQAGGGAKGGRDTATQAGALAELMTGLDFGGEEEEEHAAFICPITQEYMEDPVVASDGYSYERSAIEAWLSTRNSSPMTNQPLEDKILIPNIMLREAMRILVGL